MTTHMADRTSEAGAYQSGRWRLALTSGPHAPARARREVARLGVGGARAGDLALLVSEVVTNAVRHGGAYDDEHVVVELVASRGRVQVRVLDGGRGRPARRRPGGTRDGGWGLNLVEALSDTWGAAPGEVWFELTT